MTQRIPPDFGLAFSFNPLLWGTAMKRKLIVGIDGTRTGWIAAYIRPGGNSIELKHATRLQDLLPAFPDGIIAVDMPL
ncbi:MAG TPA: hypothetical protein VEY95_05710, partial [Azospirillaceae bacterium]|nr:hypothetical protein [Azospirillaceae bacterium]